METTTLFPMQTVPQKNNAFYLEFRQLKEYFNFRRKFKFDKKDINKQGKPFQNEYYLIDKNWLNKWKEFVGYNNISALNLNRDMNDNDYHIFKQYLIIVQSIDRYINISLSALHVSGIVMYKYIY